jgi:hypothetical protein
VVTSPVAKVPPVACTTCPAHSCPMMRGGTRKLLWPRKPLSSEPQIPTAPTEINTSPSAGFGIGSARCTISRGPNHTSACIIWFSIMFTPSFHQYHTAVVSTIGMTRHFHIIWLYDMIVISLARRPFAEKSFGFHLFKTALIPPTHLPVHNVTTDWLFCGEQLLRPDVKHRLWG